MGEVQEVQLPIMDVQGFQEAKTETPARKNINNLSTFLHNRSYKWWILMALYSFLVLAGQTAATILGKLYYNKGGKSTWIATLVQPGGFPVLIPFYFILSSTYKYPTTVSTRNQTISLSIPILALLYTAFGILLAVDCMLYAIGSLYLPVSTYSLICASQLAFNALFSYFLNAQKFTPFIINSLVLLTVSSILLVFQSDDSNSNEVSQKKYAVGFVCTVGASAGYGLMLSLTQYAFKNLLKTESFKVILDMIIYQSLAATCATVVGLFASGEWKHLHTEMAHFKLGKVSYIMTLTWTAISWQLFSIGCVGLIVEVSSLFSNVISTLGLPIVPLLAVKIFGDSMNGVKGIAMVLAIWGFVSYVYQHYLEEFDQSNNTKSFVNGNHINECDSSAKQDP